MAKKLRDIAGKGKFAGVRNSKVAPPDINDKNLYQWNSKDGVDFVKKHDTETHEYPYDADAAFKGKKDGGSKTTKYKFQKDGVYESSCNHTNEGEMCEVHGKASCPKEDDVNMQKMPKKDAKGRQYIADKKIKEDLDLDEASRNKLQAYLDKSKPQGPSRAFIDKPLNPELKREKSQELAIKKIHAHDKDKSGRSIWKKSVKVPATEETDINEVAPPSPKIEKWIKDNKERFIKQYGKEKGTQVLYAKAWKMHGQSESGTATNTDYTGPGAAGWTTGRLDAGTL